MTSPTLEHRKNAFQVPVYLDIGGSHCAKCISATVSLIWSARQHRIGLVYSEGNKNGKFCHQQASAMLTPAASLSTQVVSTLLQRASLEGKVLFALEMLCYLRTLAESPKHLHVPKSNHVLGVTCCCSDGPSEMLSMHWVRSLHSW